MLQWRCWHNYKNNMLDPLACSIPLADLRPTILEGPARKLLQPSGTHPDDYTLEIDNSTLEKFTQCARKTFNYSVLSREASYDQSAQQFGKLFHSCEELRLQHGLTDAVTQKQKELIQSHFLLHPTSPDDHRTADRMLQVLKMYNERYSADAWPERVYIHEGEKFVERPFKCELCTIEVDGTLPYGKHVIVANAEPNYGGSNSSFPVRNLHIIWTGRIDVILADSGFLWVADHKTTSSGGREFEESFRLASQTIGYSWAAQQITGHEIAGCIINAVLIKKPLKTTRGNPSREEFNRLTYFYSQDRIAEWLESTRHIVSDLASCLVRGYFPMTGPRSFKSPCVYCDYHENCQLPASQRAADLSTSLYRNVTWNPIAND